MAAWRICEHQVGSKKMMDIGRFWAIDEDDNNEAAEILKAHTSGMTKERYDKIMNRDNKKN
jgi:hypothetical protein